MSLRRVLAWFWRSTAPAPAFDEHPLHVAYQAHAHVFDPVTGHCDCGVQYITRLHKTPPPWTANTRQRVGR